MELLMKLLSLLLKPITVSVFLNIVSIALLYNVFFLVSQKKKKKKAPNASEAWPLIGHLKLFMNPNKALYKKLGTMADKYGPAFNIRLGNQEILVVSNWEVLKQCFSTQNDPLFSNRPVTLGVKYIFNEGTSIGFSPFGTYWRELRKIAAQQLLSKQRLESWKHLKISEIDASFSRLNELCRATTPIRMDDWFVELSFNVYARVVFGYQSGGRTAITGDTASNELKYKKTVEEALLLNSILFAVSDVFPCLEWVDRSRGLVRAFKHFRDELNSVSGCLIEEHRQKRSQSISKSHKGICDEQDFIDVLLSLAEQSQLPGDVDTDLVIKGIILETIAGALDTTAKTLTWTLALLLNHPHALKTAKEEIDMHVELGRHVDESDISKLVYINAIIKESMRLYPNAALIDRFTSEECEVGEFHVPAGGRLILNIWKIQRDPSVWESPLEFKPERFLSNDDKVDMDFKGQKYEFLPFGIGRRICPGVLSALQVLHLVMARLIQGFDMKAAGAGGKVDMAEMEKAGMSCCMMTPLEVLVTPRQ
ncbi:hypothetical protein MKX01_029262 [Papaver californicum]|nr:hypothetical protein MKX01_029262 [Papaver californicum]